MGRTNRRMTPEQFASSMQVVAFNLSDLKPIMTKFAKRYQASMRKNVREGMNANKIPMAPLTNLSLAGKVTNPDGSLGRKRSSYGIKPLLATQRMMKSFKAFPDDSGFIAYVTDELKKIISFWQANTPTGRPLRIHPKRDRTGQAMANAMGRKGMPVKASTAVKGFLRPARLPFALSSKQVKRSVSDLNKFVLKPFIS